MNGLEALDNMIETFDCGGYQPATIGCKDGAFKEVFSTELPIIERELKVNKILKEKKVKLSKIAEWLADNLLKDIKGSTEFYNRYIVNGYMKELTLKEMTLIVEWIKGGSI